MISEELISLSGIEILCTGTDGGHLYLKGHDVVRGHGACDVYVFFASREEELEFQSHFQGQNLIIAAPSVEFVRGMGAYARDCRVLEMK